MDDITIGVTEYVNNILVSAQPNDQIIDITVTETVETVLLDVSTTVQEVTVTATQNVIVENITVDYVNNENNININVTDGTQDVTLNVTPTLVEINILRSGGEVNILQFNTLADFPATGSSDYFYLAKDTNKLYRWTGSAYAEISATSSPVWGQIIGTLSNQTDLQNALNLKAPIASPTFTGTVSGITKTMVGLGAVDNTSDLDKPVSTATQSALNAKQPLDGDLTSIAGLTGTAGFLKKNGVNSFNLDNTTYLSSISSSDVTTALGYTPENVANKGVNSGYASLDGGGKVPSSQLPSYVDDVIEVSSFGTLPATGETGKIYITLDTNKIYRWSGSVYVEVSSSASVWGGITGTLSNQTDLQTALDAKQDDLNGTGFVKASGTTISYDNTTYYPASNPNGYTTNVGTVTSVAMSVPSAFSVSGSPITSSGTLAVTATGDSTQYIAGDGSLVTFPTAGQSGTLVREVRNTTGATLTKGTIVYISGATGNKPTVSKAIATGDSTSAQTFGMCQANIANNSNGYVVCVGDLAGLDTSAFTEGNQLYLSSTTAGAYTITKQLAPNHLVYIGIVTRAHPTLGQIEVNIQNGYELYELHDVSITSEVNNQGLFYEASTDLWKNKSIATVLGYTPANGANYVALTGNESISGDKTFSGAVINDGDLYIKQDASYAPKTGYVNLFAGAGNILTYNFGNSNTNHSLAFPTTGRVHTFPDATGTLALTSDLHNAVTIGTANGLSLSTQVLSLALASTSATGALSSTDWNTFNGKQNALTNPVTGTGTTSYLPKFTGASALGNSILYDTGSVLLVGATSASNASSKLELVSTSTVGLKIISSGANGNNTFLSIQANKEWRFLTNRGDLISGNQGDLIIRNDTDSINHIILNQGGSTTFAGTVTATGFEVGNGQFYRARRTSSNLLTDMIGIPSGTNDVRILTTGAFNVVSGALTTFLGITDTGAATFSSSVTAGGGGTVKPQFIANGGSSLGAGMSYNTGLSGTGRRNWFIGTEENVEGDFVIKCSTTAGGNAQSGNTRIQILNNGNVGIGTTAVGVRFVNAGATLASVPTLGSGTIGANAILSTNGFYGLYTGVSSEGHVWQQVQRNDGGTAVYPLILQPSGGNVGIGTTSPTDYSGFTTLHINGRSGALGGVLRLTSFDAGSGGNIYAASSAFNFNTTTAIPFVWLTQDTERMRITSAGNVLISQTTDNNDGKLEITTSGGNAIKVRQSAAGGYALDVNAANNGGTYYYANFNAVTTGVGSITSNGTTTSYNVTSDYRLKEDLKSINGLELVNKIQVYDYKWKSDGTRMDGVMAHELQEILPYAVHGLKDGDEMQQVDYSKIVPVMVQAIKDLKAELDTLKNK